MKNRYNPIIIKEMFLALLPAQIFSLITSNISNIINGLLVSNFLSSIALVALGFAGPLVNIVGAVASVISGGARVVSGRLIGRGKIDEIKGTYTNALISLSFIGLLFTVVAFTLSENIAVLLGAMAETIAPTASYIRGLAIGFIPTLIVPCLIIFLQMANLSSLSLIATVVLVISNLCFSCINIFFLDGGVFGMGVASSLSQYIAMFVLFYYLSRKRDFVSFDRTKFVFKGVLEMVALGSPGALAMFLYSFRNIALNTLATSFGGTAAISALTIMNTVMGPFDAVNIGVGNVSTSLSSVYVGENDKSAMKTLFAQTIKIGEVLAFVKVAIIVLLGKDMIALFSKDPLVTTYAYEVFVFYGLCMFVNIVLLALVSQLQSLGRVIYVNILYIFGALLFPISIAYGLNGLLGLRSIWICYLGADALETIMIILIAMFKHKKLTLSLDEILEYNKAIKDNKSMQISLKTKEEVCNISVQIEDFIKDNLNDARRARIAGLCAEELADNIIEHGFTKKKSNKDDSIDIYVSLDNDDILMRIRDNSVPFDLRKKFSSDENDPTKNIGIRMVSKLAKEVNYQISFGMNVVTVKL